MVSRVGVVTEELTVKVTAHRVTGVLRVVLVVHTLHHVAVVEAVAEAPTARGAQVGQATGPRAQTALHPLPTLVLEAALVLERTITTWVETVPAVHRAC